MKSEECRVQSAEWNPPLPLPLSSRVGEGRRTETWFNTAERVASLRYHAGLWEGTPFYPNSNTIGKGVSCQKLAEALFRAVGFCDVSTPDVAMSLGRFVQKESGSLLLPWMDSRPEFARLDLMREELLPGDMLAIYIRKIGHHCGVVLGGQGVAFIHAVDKAGVCICCLSDATWGSRLAAAWRPLPTAEA